MTTIADVRVHLVQPRGPVQPSPGSRLEWCVVEVVDSDGFTGFGEATNWLGTGSSVVAATLELLGDVVIGRDADRIGELWNDLFRRFAFLGSRGLPTAVISGIDTALWDRKGKALGRSIADLLGGPVHDRLPVYTHPVGGNWDEVIESSRALLHEGWDSLKVFPFREFFDPVHAFVGARVDRQLLVAASRRMSQLREAIGGEPALMIDVNAKLDVPTAHACIRAVEHADLKWFEDPTPPESVEALQALRARTTVPIAVGERRFTRWELAPLLEGRLVDYLMSDVCWTGGITELNRICTLAETFHIPVSPHGAMGPLQFAASAQVMATAANLDSLELLTSFRRIYDESLGEPLTVRAGTFELSDQPGLGVCFDPDWLAGHTVSTIAPLPG